MLKKSTFNLLIIIGLFFFNSLGFAATQDFELYPGKPLRLTSGLPSPLVAYCEVRLLSKDNHTIAVKMLNGSGQIHGTSLRKGDSLTLTVNHGQIIEIIANPNSDALFTNLGPQMVKAMCS